MNKSQQTYGQTSGLALDWLLVCGLQRLFMTLCQHLTPLQLTSSHNGQMVRAISIFAPKWELPVWTGGSAGGVPDFA